MHFITGKYFQVLSLFEFIIGDMQKVLKREIIVHKYFKVLKIRDEMTRLLTKIMRKQTFLLPFIIGCLKHLDRKVIACLCKHAPFSEFNFQRVKIAISTSCKALVSIDAHATMR